MAPTVRYEPCAIRAALPLEEVLKRYGVLLRRGRGRCPVCGTSQKSTSLSVRGPYWRCFACNERGDVIDLIARVDGVPLRQAFARGAAFAGIGPVNPGEPVTTRPTPRWKVQEIVRDRAWKRYVVARRQREWACEQFEYFARRRGLDHPYTVLAGEIFATAFDAEFVALYTYDETAEVRR